MQYHNIMAWAFTAWSRHGGRSEAGWPWGVIDPAVLARLGIVCRRRRGELSESISDGQGVEQRAQRRPGLCWFMDWNPGAFLGADQDSGAGLFGEFGDCPEASALLVCLDMGLGHGPRMGGREQGRIWGLRMESWVGCRRQVLVRSRPPIVFFGGAASGVGTGPGASATWRLEGLAAGCQVSRLSPIAQACRTRHLWRDHECSKNGLEDNTEGHHRNEE